MKAIVAILFLILSCAAPTFARQPASSDRTRAQMDLEALATQLRLFNAFNDRHPTTEEGLRVLVERPKHAGASWRQLLDNLPLDPWQNRYQYRLDPKLQRGYDLFSLGADGVESADDIHLQ